VSTRSRSIVLASTCRRGCVSGDSLIETVDGPVPIATLIGKSMPVVTRLPNGAVGFRLMTKIAMTAAAVPVTRVTLDNGQAVVVDRGHVFFGKGMIERPVETLVVGEPLETSWHFPEGYVYRRSDGTEVVSVGAFRVAALEDAGIADVFGGTVNETHCYFTTAGVLCKE
jgi:hypothetical protein